MPIFVYTFALRLLTDWKKNGIIYLTRNMVEDSERIIGNYSAAVFTAPIPSEYGKAAIEICRDQGVPYLAASIENPSYTTDEIRQFFVSNGLHCYNENGNVIYCGEGFLAVHTVSGGEISINLPRKYKVKPLFGADIPVCETDKITLNADKYDTIIFELI